MKLTINQLRVELASLIQANAQVNSFFWGDFARAETEVEQQYPLVYSYTTSGIQINKNTDVIPLVIGVCDKLFKDWVNLNDVESDTLQIARGIFNAINTSPKWQKIGSIQSCTASKFIDKGKDEVAGYVLTLSFKLRDTSSYCDEPFFGYDWNGSLQGSCLPVQIFKNGVLIETIPAGGLYSYTEEPCPPIEVDAVVLNTNGDEVASKTVTPTDNEIEAPDGIVHIKKENDGTISNVSTPSGATTDYIVQNNDITVNGGNDFEIHATESLDVRLRDENNNVVNPISVTHTGGHTTVVLPTNKIDVTINGITVADDAVSDVTLTLVDQNGDDVPFTQTGTELEVEIPEAGVMRSTAMLMKTGQITSYATGDDGDLEIGRDVDFFTLAEIPLMNDGSPTINSTTNRFTDELGGQTYANSILIDWSTFDGNTVLGWDIRINGGNGSVDKTWSQSLSEAKSHTNGAFLSGWFLPNKKMYENMENMSLTQVGNWSPFNITGSFTWWTSTTPNGVTSSAFLFYSPIALGSHISAQPKTSSAGYRWHAVRMFTVNGTSPLT